MLVDVLAPAIRLCEPVRRWRHEGAKYRHFVSKANVMPTEAEVIEQITRQIGRISDETAGVKKFISTIPADLTDVKGLKSELHSRMDVIETALKRNGGTLGEVKAETAEMIEYKTAFTHFVRSGEAPGLKELQQKALSVGNDPDGGYLVPTELSNRIITKVFETSPIRQVANVVTVSGAEVEFLVDADEAGANWVDETSPRQETKAPQLGKKRIAVHNLAANPLATEQLLEDAAISVETWLTDKLSKRFARAEASAFVLGTGRGQPMGFLTYATTPEGNVVQRIKSGAATGFPDGSGTADALLALVYSLKAAYRARGVFLMPRSVQLKIRQLKDERGNYLWQPGIAAGQPDRLLSFPVYDAEDMPGMAAGSLSIAFGDFNEAYTIVDRFGIRILRDPYSRKPFVEFAAKKRVGGDVVNPEAYALLQTGA